MIASRGLRKHESQGYESENHSQRELHDYWSVLRPALNFAVMAIFSSLRPV